MEKKNIISDFIIKSNLKKKKRIYWKNNLLSGNLDYLILAFLLVLAIVMFFLKNWLVAYLSLALFGVELVSFLIKTYFFIKKKLNLEIGDLGITIYDDVLIVKLLRFNKELKLIYDELEVISYDNTLEKFNFYDSSYQLELFKKDIPEEAFIFLLRKIKKS